MSSDTTATSKRGDAAWKQERERIAERNEQARKEGRARRAERERVHAQARHAADRRDIASAVASHPR